METFRGIICLGPNLGYLEQRRKSLYRLDLASIDEPITGLIDSINQLSYCFTLQCCYGHFLHDHQSGPRNADALPESASNASVEYRIAYVALCLQNNRAGKRLFGELGRLPSIDPAYIQFGCAGWFWEQQVNSYVLQVEPKRFKTKDRIVVDYQEALHIQRVRDRFFSQLEEMISGRLG